MVILSGIFIYSTSKVSGPQKRPVARAVGQETEINGVPDSKKKRKLLFCRWDDLIYIGNPIYSNIKWIHWKT